MLGFKHEFNCVIVGASGGVGAGFSRLLSANPQCEKLILTSRDKSSQPSYGSKSMWMDLDVTDENSIRQLASCLKEKETVPHVVLNLSGVLHTEEFGPEKTWRHLNIETMHKVFAINTFGVALLGKHLIPLMPRKGRSIFASLSARVGSVSDNRLGGWYSYRASKAAQNMMIKNLAIEAERRWKDLICVALHPGTVDTSLSAPFTRKYDPKKLFSPQKSTDLLVKVLEGLTPEDNGGFFAWDGSKIEY